MNALERRVDELNDRCRADSVAVFRAFTEGEGDPGRRIARAYRRYAADLRDMQRLLENAGADREARRRVELLARAMENLARAYAAPEGKEGPAMKRARKALKAWKQARGGR